MNSLFADLELGRSLNLDPPEPGRRLFSVKIEPGVFVKMGFETQADVSAVTMQHRIPTDDEISAALFRAAELLAGAPAGAHRGALD